MKMRKLTRRLINEVEDDQVDQNTSELLASMNAYFNDLYDPTNPSMTHIPAWNWKKQVNLAIKYFGYELDNLVKIAEEELNNGEFYK